MAEEGNKTTIADLKINSFQNPVENLPDRPTMSAAELKRHFDSNSEELREAFNKLIDRLTGREGAGEIFTAAGISVEVALGERIQWNGKGVKFIRLNADRVLETSEDGETWEATGSSGHVLLDREGNALPQRSRMIFDQCEVTDDGEKTIIHGIKGEPGLAGYTPVKGKDYFTQEEIEKIKEEVGASMHLVFTNITISSSAFVPDTVYAGYTYKVDIPCDGVTAEHIPTVNLGMVQATGGNFSPIAISGEGKVTIYAQEVEAETFTIPSIVCVKGGA